MEVLGNFPPPLKLVALSINRVLEYFLAEVVELIHITIWQVVVPTTIDNAAVHIVSIQSFEYGGEVAQNSYEVT